MNTETVLLAMEFLLPLWILIAAIWYVFICPSKRETVKVSQIETSKPVEMEKKSA